LLEEELIAERRVAKNMTVLLKEALLKVQQFC
jgi:hypothetical protein